MNTTAIRFIAVATLVLIPSLSFASTRVGHVASRQGIEVTVCLSGSPAPAVGGELSVMRNLQVQRGPKAQPVLQARAVGVVRINDAGDGKCLTATVVSGTARRWDAVARQ